MGTRKIYRTIHTYIRWSTATFYIETRKNMPRAGVRQGGGDIEMSSVQITELRTVTMKILWPNEKA